MTPETCTVHVFREDPRWDGVERWWHMGTVPLMELHVATYDCPIGPNDPSPTYWREWAIAKHPGHVIVAV